MLQHNAEIKRGPLQQNAPTSFQAEFDTVRRIVEYWGPQDPCIPNSQRPLPQRESAVVKMDMDTTTVIHYCSTDEVQIPVHNSLWIQYIVQDLQNVHYCFIREIDQHYFQHSPKGSKFHTKCHGLSLQDQ